MELVKIESMRCTHMYNWKQRRIILCDRALQNTVRRIRSSKFFVGLITIHWNARLRMRTTGIRNCPWVSVSLFRTRFMGPAIISLGPGIQLCYWLCAFQVYYGTYHTSKVVRHDENGEQGKVHCCRTVTTQSLAYEKLRPWDTEINYFTPLRVIFRVGHWNRIFWSTALKSPWIAYNYSAIFFWNFFFYFFWFFKGLITFQG